MQMQGEGAEPDSVHRAITEGQLDVHPTLDAIVVHYQMDAVVVSVYGDPMVADRKECRKLLKIQNLSANTNIQALAWHIISKCDIINTSRLPEVEQLLVYLQNRSKGKEGDRDALESSSRQIQEQINDLQNPTETATMSELDSYLECLYEDIQSKIRGTGLVLQLARSPDNLCFLMENESLFLALARVLKEDWKKSIELSTNIVYIFFCFSTFTVFHKMLAQHKIGSTCMTVVEHEIKRFKSLTDDLAEKKKNCKSEDTGATSSKAKKEYEKAKKKYQQLLKKQETLLRVALYLLLNLSEDTSVELKMRNKNLIPQLTTLLERSNKELLILVISFLKKLSIYAENKDDMAKQDIIRKLTKVIPCDNEILVNVALRLLLNLSFDPDLRQDIVKMGMLPKLSALLKEENHRVVVLCILYHISMDSKARSMFSYTDCIPELMKLILESPDDLVDPETIALGINLACSPRNVQIMCNGSTLKMLIRRALKYQDSLLLKMLRNISRCQPVKKLFLPFLSELCTLLKKQEMEGEEEVCVELLGILGNLSLPEVDFHKVVTDLELLPFILSKLKDSSVQDDLLLEVVILCGTFALDEKCAGMLVEASVPELLITILKAKQEDDEIVLQIVYLFYLLVLHESTRHKVTKQSLAPDYLLELMNDKNQEVCKLCSKTLDIILECDPELALKIKHERFRWHNFQWLEMVAGETMYHEADEEADLDYLDPHYLHSAAELYDMHSKLDGAGPELHGMMMGAGQHPAEMLGAFPGGEHPANMEFEYGRNFDPFDDEIKAFHPNTPNPYGAGSSMGSDYFTGPPPGHPATMLAAAGPSGSGGVGPLRPPGPGATAGEIEDSERTDVLSPHQYAKLMSSMQDPLALFSTSLSLDATKQQDDFYPQDFDPLEMFARQGYNISPTYGGGGVAGGRGQGLGLGEDSTVPYTMGRPTGAFQPRPPTHPTTYQPRPPPTMFQPRPPTAPRNQPSRR